MSARALAAILLACLTAAGCAMAPLAPPQASFETLQAVRASNMAPAAVGAFTAAPGAPSDMDKQIAVRAGVQAAPGGSFAKYLGDTVAADLNAAGRLDAKSTLVISGVVTDTHVDSAMPTAHARLAARFTLVRDGKAAFDKTLGVESTWDSNFIGAVAIPDAIDHYMALFQKLAAALFADPDFQAAAKAS